MLTDLVSLVRHAVQLDDELAPYPRLVKQRYEAWLADQEAAGRHFTVTQRWWLAQIAEHIGVNLAMTADDFDYGELFDRGGQIAARKQFGRELPALLDEMNAVLVVGARSPRPGRQKTMRVVRGRAGKPGGETPPLQDA